MKDHITLLPPFLLLLLTIQHRHAVILSLSLLAHEQGEEYVERYGAVLAETEFRRTTIMFVLLFLIGVAGLSHMPCQGLCLLPEVLFSATVLVGLIIAFLEPKRTGWAFLLSDILGARPYLLVPWTSLYLLPNADVNTRRVLLALLGLYAGGRLLTTRYRKPDILEGMTFRREVLEKRYQLLWGAVIALSVIGVLLAVYVPVAVVMGILMLIIVIHQEVDMWPYMKTEGRVW